MFVSLFNLNHYAHHSTDTPWKINLGTDTHRTIIFMDCEAYCKCHSCCSTPSTRVLYCWTFHFRGDEVKFVDLQFVKVSRPTIDLNYFFCSSTTSHFREEHFNDLLKIYHDVLIAELKGLGYSDDVYTMSQLVEDYNDCFAFGLIVGMFHGQVRELFQQLRQPQECQIN